MYRTVSIVVCLLLASAAFAAPAPGKDRRMLLDVEPAAAPIPALKYQLLPEVAEMNPGNAVPAYLKCFCEQNNFFYAKESVDERERLVACPLTDIKPGSLKGYGGSATRQADFAARLEFADWNLLPQMREQGYNLLLPEVQQMRMLANALLVRGRGQLVDRDFDGAVATLKTMFALARHLGEHPTIITGLVGAAVAQLGCNLIEEFVQQPGAPNLYWALTQLPSPLVDNRKAISADRKMIEATFGYLMDNRRPWSRDDVAAGIKKMKELGAFIEMSNEDKQAADAWMRDRLKDEEWLTTARKGLIGAGAAADAVAKYPPEQVLFFDLHRKGREHHDEAIKLIPLPYWQSESPLAELEKSPMEMEAKLTRQMVFAVGKVKNAHVRLEQRLALLRAAEAIRLDAAKNGGKLPANLSLLSVPIPNDPVSGKSFDFKLDGITATLEGKETPVSGGGTMKYGYEVRLRK